MTIEMVITGPMFSGKTKFMINQARSPEGAGLFVRSTHERPRTDHPAMCCDELIKAPDDITEKWIAETSGIYDRIFVDEIQFIVPRMIELMHKNSTPFVLAGLDFDYMGSPFSTTHLATTLARAVVRCQGAKCRARGCASVATHTMLKGRARSPPRGHQLILVGGDDMYRPVCKLHHPMTPGKWWDWVSEDGRPDVS